MYLVVQALFENLTNMFKPSLFMRRATLKQALIELISILEQLELFIHRGDPINSELQKKVEAFLFMLQADLERILTNTHKLKPE